MTDITELAHGKSLRKKLNRRLNDAYGFQRTSGGKHTTISLSIAECKSIIAAMDERLSLVEALASEKRICATWRKTAEANSEKLEKAQAKADVYDMLRDDYGLREKVSDSQTSLTGRLIASPSLKKAMLRSSSHATTSSALPMRG